MNTFERSDSQVDAFTAAGITLFGLGGWAGDCYLDGAESSAQGSAYHLTHIPGPSSTHGGASTFVTVTTSTVLTADLLWHLEHRAYAEPSRLLPVHRFSSKQFDDFSVLFEVLERGSSFAARTVIEDSTMVLVVGRGVPFPALTIARLRDLSSYIAGAARRTGG